VTHKHYATQEAAEAALRRMRASGAGSESDSDVSVSEEDVRKRFDVAGPTADGEYVLISKATRRERYFPTREERDAALEKSVRTARGAESKKLRKLKEEHAEKKAAGTAPPKPAARPARDSFADL